MKKWAIYSCILANVLDICTTMVNPFGYETNEMMRNAAFHPVLTQIVIIKLLFYGMWGGLLLVSYFSVKNVSQRVADFLVIGVCVYDASTFIDVLIKNIAIAVGYIHTGG